MLEVMEDTFEEDDGRRGHCDHGVHRRGHDQVMIGS